MMLHPLYSHYDNSQLDDVRTLFISDMVCDAAIGVYHTEKGRKQKIVVNIAVRVSNPTQPVGDEFSRVLDYGFLRDAVYETVGGEHIHLAETACEAIADLCMSAPAVQAVYVRVGKLEAFDDCEAVGCELVRHRAPGRVKSNVLAAKELTA